MYAKIEDGIIIKTGRRPRWFQDNPEETDDPVPVTDEQLREAGWYPVIHDIPEVDGTTHTTEQNPRDQWLIGETQVTATYTVRELTSEELAARRQEERQSLRQGAATLLNELVLLDQANALVDDENTSHTIISSIAPLFPDWSAGMAVEAGDRFFYEGELLEVITGHTTQEDWIPTELPALYKVYRASGEVSAWVQPLGSEGAYQIGDRVTHNGQVWESTEDNNVWEPGVFGWVVADS